MKIAIIGATSTIAREFTTLSARKAKNELHLFSRKPKNLQKVSSSGFLSSAYTDFNIHQKYDAIINFVGCGDPKKLKELNDEIVFINDTFDNLVLKYLKKNKTVKYIYLSSGASHLVSFKKPIRPDSKQSLDLKKRIAYDPYSIAKYISELKHRTLKKLNIVDLRIYNYLQHGDVSSEHSLIGNIFRCIRDNNLFKTDMIDLKRDYINAEIFYDAVESVLQAGSINRAYDVYSKEPISKFELLEILSNQYSLKYRIEENYNTANFNITGVKDNYFSQDYSLGGLGFKPKSSSADLIQKQASLTFSQAKKY